MKSKPNNFSRIWCTAVALLLIASLSSCNKQTTDSRQAGEVEVSVSLADAVFEELVEIENPATASLLEGAETSAAQVDDIKLSDDLFLRAELSPVRTDEQASSSKGFSPGQSTAVVQSAPLTPGVAYKLVVYNSGGTYITERNYIRGQENAANSLLLDGGTTYTFIAYSVNTTDTPPPITFSGGAQTLANSSVSITGTQSFMYFRRELTISGNAPTNFVEVVLRHRTSQITTVIDASSTGLTVNAVTSSFNLHFPSAVVPLSTGVLAGTGTITTVPVSFPTTGTAIVTSTPVIVNASPGATTNYTIASLQIGTVTNTTVPVFTGLSVVPGVRYTLRLTVTPQDIYLTHEGLPAARINGDIWALHNLGANTALEPNPTTLTSAYHGNYYQWGRSVSVGNGMSTVVNANWSATNSPPSNSWNAGTVAVPLKGTADPCPAGYRLPTSLERNRLVAGTTSVNIGTSTASNTNYSGGRVATSTRNANVRITFPRQGWYNTAGTNPYTPSPMALRGNSGWYWISDMETRVAIGLISVTDASITSSGRPATDNANTRISHNIRCVGIPTT